MWGVSLFVQQAPVPFTEYKAFLLLKKQVGKNASKDLQPCFCSQQESYSYLHEIERIKTSLGHIELFFFQWCFLSCHTFVTVQGWPRQGSASLSWGAVTTSVPDCPGPISHLPWGCAWHSWIPKSFSCILPVWALPLASHLENSLELGHAWFCSSSGETHAFASLLLPVFLALIQ